MGCEMCGIEAELKEAIVEGTILKVCNNCAKFGNVVLIAKPKLSELKQEKMLKPKLELLVEDIIKDYSSVIRNARIKLNLTQTELASKTATKESLIQSIEAGHIALNLDLAKKLERFLNVKLITEYKEISKGSINLKDENLTIADLIEMKKKVNNG